MCVCELNCAAAEGGKNVVRAEGLEPSWAV
jgi:hypothetical protein